MAGLIYLVWGSTHPPLATLYTQGAAVFLMQPGYAGIAIYAGFFLGANLQSTHSDAQVAADFARMVIKLWQ